MNNYETNLYTGMVGVLNVLEENRAIWTGHEQFEKSFEELERNIDIIQQLHIKQTQRTQGVTEIKSKARKKLVEKAEKIKKAGYAYGISAEDAEITGKFSIRTSRFNQIRDSEVLAEAKNILKNGKEIETELSEFKISIEDFTELESAIDCYNEVLVKPREMIVEKKVSTMRLKKLIEETQKQILRKKMDAYIEIYYSEAPEFYRAYKGSRAGIYAGERKIYFMGKVVESESGIGIAGAKVELSGSGIMVKTSKRGNFRFKFLSPRTYSLRVEAEGFEEYLVSGIVIEEGKTYRRKVLMSYKL